MEPSTIPLRLVGRIGAGDKLHPLVLYPHDGVESPLETLDVLSAAHDPRSSVFFACTCPGTRNGHARLTWTGLGTPTCTPTRRR